MNNDALIRPYGGSDPADAAGDEPAQEDSGPAATDPDVAIAGDSFGDAAKPAVATEPVPESPVAVAGNATSAAAGRKRWIDGADPTDPPHPDGLARRVQQARERQIKLEKELEEQRAKVDRCSRDWRQREETKRRRDNERLGAFITSLAPHQASLAIQLIAEGQPPEEVMRTIGSGTPP